MPHENHYWLRGYKRSTMSKHKFTKLPLPRTNFWTMKTVIIIQRFFKHHCFQWKQACWENDWPKVKRKIHHKERPLMSVGTFTVSFIDIQSCHLWTHTYGTWIFFALKQKRRRMQMKCMAYSRIRVKNWQRARKINRWLQLSWRATGTYFFRLLPDTISEKSKAEKWIPDNNLCCV